MVLTKRQRQKRASETGRQAGRRQRRDKKKVEARAKREAEMVQYLADHGWRQSGPLGDVWKIDNWKDQRDVFGFEVGYMPIPEGFKKIYTPKEPKNWETAEVKMSLRQAYKTQLKLDAMGYVKPQTADDDLADIL